jgi:alpha-beta hydrolase superfamily lysophospholipase
MVPRLKTLGKLIAAAGYDVRFETGYCNTDRHIAGTRLRHPGKGRWGTRLIVSKDGTVVFDHNAAETYKRNEDVVWWMAQQGIKVNT